MWLLGLNVVSSSQSYGGENGSRKASEKCQVLEFRAEEATRNSELSDSTRTVIVTNSGHIMLKSLADSWTTYVQRKPQEAWKNAVRDMKEIFWKNNMEPNL